MLIYTTNEAVDKADEVQLEIDILRRYLPKQLTTSELEAIVSTVIEDAQVTSAKDMGKIMKIVKEKVGFTAEPKLISDIVRLKLGEI